MRGHNDPFERMEELFEQMRHSATGPWVGGDRHAHGHVEPTGRALPGGQGRDAGITLERRDEGYVVLADLPGFEREEIELTLDDGVLTIDGTHEVTDDQAYRQRTVSESVRVPGEVSREDVEATYRNGVLEVTLPVAEGTDDQYRIEIE